MLTQSLYFTTPKKVEIKEADLPPLQSNQILVKTLLSAISAGTELLVYNNQMPKDTKTDPTITALSGQLTYPLKYGYSAVGQIVEIGKDVDKKWLDQIIFAFNPHETYFITTPQEILLLPQSLTPENAVFLPNMETAINLVMDGAPLMGENVITLGQGIVGLLTTAILANHPIAKNITFDKHSIRQKASLGLGASLSLDPSNLKDMAQAKDVLSGKYYQGADLIFELSGNPAAIDLALEFAGYNSRIIIGSWYGTKQTLLNLGDQFHRNRIQIRSSQVSTIAPELAGRWNKKRRFDLAWNLIEEIKPSKLITHKYPLSNATEAYQEIHQHPEKCIQVVFTY